MTLNLHKGTAVSPVRGPAAPGPAGRGPADVPGEPGRARRGALEVDDVAIVFEAAGAPLRAVDGVSLALAPGEFVSLLGPSGCGKSSLLHAIAGFLKPARGALRLDGAPIRGPGPERGLVFQQYSLFPWKSVLRNVMFAPLAAGRGRREAERTARELLELVGLAACADRFPGSLSGGMQQRVALARALAARPTVLLLDEPFAALDAQTRARMQEHLLELWARFGLTVLFVTHDIEEALFLADRVLVMSAAPGRLVGDFAVPLPRPRADETRLAPPFTALRRACLELVRRESQRAFELGSGAGAALASGPADAGRARA